MEKGSTTDKYFMDQTEAIARFLSQHDMQDVKCRDSPMPEVVELYSDSERVSEGVTPWCRSIIGCVHFRSNQ